MKIDKVSILAGILRRNALRREAQLPLLDVWALYRKEAAYQRAWALHDAHYPALRAEVIVRLATERGPDFIRTRLAAWIVHTEALRMLRDRSPTEQRHTTSTLS
ncbi:hypothetical protein [Bradyrhizobium sp. P5_C11_2]